MKSNLIDKIFYINLRQDESRKKFIESQISKLNIQVERFAGITPSIKEITEGKLKKYYDKASSPLKNHFLHKSEHKRVLGVFGVYLSHYAIHKKAFYEDIGNYVVLEDDCLLHEDWIEKLNTFMRNEHTWDIVRSLYHPKFKHITKFNSCHCNSNFNQSDADCHNIFGGAHASLFNGSSKEKILEHIENEKTLHIDAVYSTTNLNVFNLYFSDLAEFSSNIPSH